MLIYPLLFLAGAIAWFISTSAAGGAAALLIPVIGFLLGPQLVAPVISVAAFVANPSRILFFYPYINWSVIKFLLPGSLLGALLGAWSLTQINIQMINIILGLFLLSYVFQYHFSKKKLSLRMPLAGFFPLGLVVSFLSGLVGATGPVLNPFMLNYGLQKEHLVATKSFNSLIMQLTKLSSYTLFGLLTLQSASYGILMGLGAILGVYISSRHLLEIDNRRFIFYTHAIMLFSGVLMLAKAFF